MFYGQFSLINTLQLFCIPEKKHFVKVVEYHEWQSKHLPL